MCVYASNCAHVCMSDTFSSKVFACDLAYKLWSVSDYFSGTFAPSPVEASACNMLVLHLATVTLRYVPFHASPASELSPPMAAAPALLCNLTPSAQAFICFQRVPFGAKRQCRSYGACLVWLTFTPLHYMVPQPLLGTALGAFSVVAWPGLSLASHPQA